MDANTANSLLQYPMMAVLIWLLVKQQAQTDKLFEMLLASEKTHVETILKILSPTGRRATDTPDPVQPE